MVCYNTLRGARTVRARFAHGARAVRVLPPRGYLESCEVSTCGTNVMMQLYCSRYLNNAYRFYWRSMRLCYPNPPFSQLAC